MWTKGLRQRCNHITSSGGLWRISTYLSKHHAGRKFLLTWESLSQDPAVPHPASEQNGGYVGLCWDVHPILKVFWDSIVQPPHCWVKTYDFPIAWWTSKGRALADYLKTHSEWW
jgi:hypothetical protein